MNKIDKLYNTLKSDNNLKPIAEAFNKEKETEVLIFCYAYNHEKYIANCLDSMLKQLVDFNVKIIVHNDNSTDKTKEIIESYRTKHKEIIKVINQTNNLYSKEHALLPIFSFLRKYLEGKYIAMCEGDDYWTNPLKLKTQVELLNKYPKCHFCVHKVDVLNDETQKVYRTIPAKEFKLKSSVLSSDKFIHLTSIRYPFQTSSYMVRAMDFSNYLDNLPKFAEIMPTEDESTLLYFGQLGEIIYINKSFSVYRKFSDGSWSNDHKEKDLKQNIERLNRMIVAMKEFDSFTCFKYKHQVDFRIKKHQLRIMLLQKKHDEIFLNKSIKKQFRKQYPKEYYSMLLRRLLKKDRN